MLSFSKFTTRLLSILPLALTVAACSATRDSSGDGSNDPLVTPLAAKDTLTGQGFTFVRTDSFAYTTPGTDDTTGILCDGYGHCWKTYHHNPGTDVSGSADRYQHADGRIAYIDPRSDVIVGPVLPGAFLGSGAQPHYPNAPTDRNCGGSTELTLRVTDLKLGGHGTFDLTTQWAVSFSRLIGYECWGYTQSGVDTLHPAADANRFADGSHTAPGSFVNGQPAYVEDFVASVTFTADGKKVTNYAATVDQIDDEMVVATFDNPSRSTKNCGNPFSCMAIVYDRNCGGQGDVCNNSQEVNGVYATEQACQASCERRGSQGSAICVPALDECAPPVVPVDPTKAKCATDPNVFCNPKTEVCAADAKQKTTCVPLPAACTDPGSGSCSCLEATYPESTCSVTCWGADATTGMLTFQCEKASWKP